MKFTKKILSVLCVGVLILSGIGASSDALWKNYRPYGGFDGSWKRFMEGIELRLLSTQPTL